MTNYKELTDLSEKQLRIYFNIVSVINKLSSPFINVIKLNTILPKGLEYFTETDYFNLIMSLEVIHNIEIEDVEVNAGLKTIDLILYLEKIIDHSSKENRYGI